MDKKLQDLIEVMTAHDGDYNDALSAYVTAYPIDADDSSAKIVYELEYVDPDNEFEVIETSSYTVSVSV